MAISLLLLVLLFGNTKSDTYRCDASSTGTCRCSETASGQCILKCTNANSCNGMEFICRAGDPCQIECGQNSCNNAVFDGKEATTVTVTCQSTGCNGDAVDGNDMRLLCGTNTCSVTCNQYGCQHFTAIYHQLEFFTCFPTVPTTYCDGVQTIAYSQTIDPTLSPSEQPTVSYDFITFEPWYKSSHPWYPSFIIHGMDCDLPSKVEMYQKSEGLWVENNAYYFEPGYGHRYAWSNIGVFNLSLSIRITSSSGTILTFADIIESYDQDTIWPTTFQICSLSPTDSPSNQPSMNPSIDDAVYTHTPSMTTGEPTFLPTTNPTSIPSVGPSSSTEIGDSPAVHHTSKQSSKPNETQREEEVHPGATTAKEYGIELKISLTLNTSTNTSTEHIQLHILTVVSQLIADRIDNGNCYDEGQKEIEVNVTLDKSEATISSTIYVCDEDTEEKLIASLSDNPIEPELMQTINTEENDIEVIGTPTSEFKSIRDTIETEQVKDSTTFIGWIIIVTCVVLLIGLILCFVYYLKRHRKKNQEVPKSTMRVSTMSHADNIMSVDEHEHIETNRDGYGAENVDNVHNGILKDDPEDSQIEELYDNKETLGYSEGGETTGDQPQSDIGHVRDTKHGESIKERKETDCI